MPCDAGIEFGTGDTTVVVGVHSLDAVAAMVAGAVIDPLRGVSVVRHGRGPGGRRSGQRRDEQQAGKEDVWSVHACKLQWGGGRAARAP